MGYSRAVRVGAFVVVSGSAPVDGEGKVTAKGDVYGQTVRCLRIIEGALAEAGGQLEHVIRTRVYVTDITRWKDVARAHGEFFAQIRPATTLVQVSALIDPDILVEVEADAIVE
jgi:enamine deaminase RidA (YjgF/YER057c/UK114 family)